MGIFNRKAKKRGTTLTDEDREAASDRRKQLKELRDLKFQKEKVEHLLSLAEAKAELNDLTGADDNENMFGLGSSEMQLINILTKGKASSFLNPNITPELQPLPTENNANIDTQAQAIVAALPSKLKEQLKGLDIEATKRAVELVHQS